MNTINNKYSDNKEKNKQKSYNTMLAWLNECEKINPPSEPLGVQVRVNWTTLRSLLVGLISAWLISLGWDLFVKDVLVSIGNQWRLRECKICCRTLSDVLHLLSKFS